MVLASEPDVLAAPEERRSMQRIGGDRHQRLRLRRALLGAAGGVAFTAFVWLLHAVGMVRADSAALAVLSALYLSGFLVCVGLLWSGRNRQWRDPSMTLPQVLWGNAGIIVLAQFTGPLEPLLLAAALVALMFAALRLSVGRAVVANLVTLLLLVLASVVSLFAAPRGFDATVEIMQVAAFVLLAAMTSVVGFEVNGLRSALLRRNEDVNRAFERVRAMTVTDELTGIRNRRYLLDAMQHQKALAERGGHVFSICHVDLDHFQRINDVFGRETGDDVLKAFAGIAMDCVREVDFVARLGGEEFVLVLVGTPVGNARVVAERMRERLADLVISDLIPEFRITASIGMTQFRPGEAVERALARADRALYDAKHMGRNRIVLIPEDDPDERRGDGAA